MERYHSWGGASNPHFRHRVSVTVATDEMMNWCSVWPGDGPFERYYIEWGAGSGLTVFQFEQEEPAILFSLKFGHQ